MTPPESAPVHVTTTCTQCHVIQGHSWGRGGWFPGCLETPLAAKNGQGDCELHAYMLHRIYQQCNTIYPLFHVQVALALELQTVLVYKHNRLNLQNGMGNGPVSFLSLVPHYTKNPQWKALGKGG